MAKVKKITLEQLESAMRTFNDRNPEKNGTSFVSGVIVYKASNWKKPYSLESRSYRVWNNNLGYQAGKISNAVTGWALDGSDDGVRLDWYKWEVDYCYMEE